MKKFYRASQHGRKIRGTESSNPNSSWRKLENIAGLTKEDLQKQGYRVKMVIDLEKSDIDSGIIFIDKYAPEPAKGIVGILKGLFGR